MRFTPRGWFFLVLVTLGLMVPSLIWAQADGRLTGPEIMNLLEPPLITLVPPGLFSLVAYQTTWVDAWSDIWRRGVIVAVQVGIAILVYVFRKSLDAQTVSMVLTAVTGIWSGLTVPARAAGVSAMAKRESR